MRDLMALVELELEVHVMIQFFDRNELEDHTL